MVDLIKTSSLSINSTIISTFILEQNHPNESNILYYTESPFAFSIKNILLVLFLVVLALSTICGNTFVILAIFVDFHLRLPTHYMMGSLALADLMLNKTSSLQQLYQQHQINLDQLIEKRSISIQTFGQSVLKLIDSK